VKAACDYNPEDPGDVAESDADTPEIIRHRIFMYRATEALRLAREFGFKEALRQEITDDVIDAAQKAAEAWSGLMSNLAPPLPPQPSNIDPLLSCLMRVRALVFEWFASCTAKSTTLIRL
jgi:hypothetical protein